MQRRKNDFLIDISTELKITTDKGNNWSELQFTERPGFIQDVCFYKNNIWLSFFEGAGCIWFGNFVYHSSDYGNSWNKIEANELGFCTNMIAINESTVIAQSNSVRISYDKFLVKSTDYGRTLELYT